MIKHLKNIFFGSLILIIIYSLFFSSKKSNSSSKEKNKIKYPKTLIINNYTKYDLANLAKMIMYKVLKYDSIYLDIRYLPQEILENEFILKGYIIKNSEYDHTYMIFVTKYLREIEYIDFLTHELTHLDQFEKKELVQLELFGSVFIYKGDTVDLSKLKYSQRNHEKDAFMRQNNVFIELKKYLYK